MKVLLSTLLFSLLSKVASAETVPNDSCEGALPLVVDIFGDGYDGNFTFATSDSAAVSDDCFTGNAPVYPGLWYSIEGTGRQLVFYSCDFPNNTVISIYEGSCGSLKCLVGGSSCGDEGLDFFAQRGKTYYALLQSDKTDALTEIQVFPPVCGLFFRSIFCPLTFQGVFGRFVRGILAALGFR